MTVVSPRSGEEHASTTAELVIERGHVDAGPQPGEPRLATDAAPPHLADHPTVGHRASARHELGVDQGDDIRSHPLDGDERAGVQEEGHAGRA